MKIASIVNRFGEYLDPSHINDPISDESPVAASNHSTNSSMLAPRGRSTVCVCVCVCERERERERE